MTVESPNLWVFCLMFNASATSSARIADKCAITDETPGCNSVHTSPSCQRSFSQAVHLFVGMHFVRFLWHAGSN